MSVPRRQRADIRLSQLFDFWKPADNETSARHLLGTDPNPPLPTSSRFFNQKQINWLQRKRRPLLGFSHFSISIDCTIFNLLSPALQPALSDASVPSDRNHPPASFPIADQRRRRQISADASRIPPSVRLFRQRGHKFVDLWPTNLDGIFKRKLLILGSRNFTRWGYSYNHKIER